MPSKGDEQMRRCVQGLGSSLLFVLLAVALAPGLAGAQTLPPGSPSDPLAILPGADMTLYEATENVRYIGKLLLAGQLSGGRKATAELFGVARRGSPLCPPLDPTTDPTTPCHVNATGTSDVDLATGLGNIVGTVTVVVAGLDPVDGPEVVVRKGKFVGTIDFRPALQLKQPYGTVSAILVVNGGGVFPFTGTFRQPVDGGSGPVYWMGSGFIPVNANEFALGFPAVRFEINFTQ